MGLRDVASAAGVSHQTVSRVINGHPNVHPDTRNRVHEAVSALGFRPNRAARALAVGRADTVTVLTSDTSLYGYASTLQGIEEAARATGTTVAISVLESSAPAVVESVVDDLSGPGVGAIAVIAFDTASLRALRALPPGVPVAAAVEPALGDPRRRNAGKPYVWLDDRAASREATRHLLDRGHRQVHHLPIPSWAASSERELGWRDALVDAGIEPPPLCAPGWSTAHGHAHGAVLAADPGVTAVLAGNDDLALGVIRAMNDAGRAVPESVSVIGFDDIPQAAYLTPRLTTVAFDFVALGRAVFQLLQRDPDDRDAIGAIRRAVPPARLVVRESTAPATSH